MEKKYDRLSAEAACIEQWAQEHTYACNTTNKQLYAIDTPPPTISGTLHIGHVFSYTQTDIIARYERMSGKAVFYPFGFDDNGLPTERYVEKKCDVKAHMMKRSEFIALCLKESKAAAHTFTELWKKLGISAYWEHTYSTISADAQRISQQSFLELLEKDLVYRKYEPALYCTNCRTSVSQAELDDLSVPSCFYTLTFMTEQHEPIAISTTRPELLGACVAVLYHPSDSRYTHLRNTHAITPLYNARVPLLPDEKVIPEKGTGLVMVCTFGDTTDIEWYKKYAFDYIQIIGLDGKMTAHAGSCAGLSVTAARAHIVEALKKEGVVQKEVPLVHTVSVHERCKTLVEYVLLAQWFVRLLPYKKQFIDIADTIAWYPSFMKARYVDWVEHLQWDWCISRQRMYGIPFPVWHCTDCRAVVPAQREHLPVDPQESAAPSVCTECESTALVPDTDVMDTWNTSSLTPYLVHDLYTTHCASLEQKQFLPMALRPQAHDIIRTWAFDTIVKTFFHEGQAPWNSIVISGHVLSEKAEKISKSKGNETKTPDALLAEFPADAIRYWTASATLGNDVAFSPEQIKLGNRLITKLWNAFLFAEPHIQEASMDSVPASLYPVNEWLLDALTTTEQTYHTAFAAHEFSAALHAVEQFFWQYYCDNYIELVKHALFNPDQYERSFVDAVRWTLYHVGIRLLQLYAPYLPFVTESIYQALYKTKEHTASLHQTVFAAYAQPFVYDTSRRGITWVIESATRVRKLKTTKQLSLKTPLQTLVIGVETDAQRSFLVAQEQLIKGVTQAAFVDIKMTEQEGVDGLSVAHDNLFHLELYLKKDL